MKNNLPAAAGGQPPCKCESQLALALEALSGLLPLAEKLFNNTVAAALEKGIPLQPKWVTFDDLKYVQKSRAILYAAAQSSQGIRLDAAAGKSEVAVGETKEPGE